MKLIRIATAILVVATLLTTTAEATPASRVVEGDDVMYVGGTLPNLRPGAIGRLDLTNDHRLAFTAGEAKVEIPYREIRSFHYEKRLARRLGVIGTVAVVMVKRRQRRHFVEIAYTGNEGGAQVALFEISKDAAQSTVAVLSARAPRRRS